MSVKGQKRRLPSWNDSRVIVEKVRKQRVSVEKVRYISRLHVKTACLIKNAFPFRVDKNIGVHESKRAPLRLSPSNSLPQMTKLE